MLCSLSIGSVLATVVLAFVAGFCGVFGAWVFGRLVAHG